MSDLPPVLTVSEVARMFRIGRNAAYEAVARGEIPSIRFGRSIRIPTARLLGLLGVAEEEVLASLIDRTRNQATGDGAAVGRDVVADQECFE